MKLRHYFVASSALALISTTAFAQDAKPASETQSDDIVVTATRSDSLLSKTPIAITAVTGEGLRTQGITNPTALAESVPNLSIDRANGLQITIRGVTSTDGTEKGDPSAAFLLDGIYIARPQVQEVSFFDIKRVEVLRGPQGTLYGRNTTAGLINVLANTPDYDKLSGSVDLAYGNFRAFQGTGVINVPVSTNFALRAAVNWDQRDSYLLEGTGVTQVFDPFKKNLSFRLSGGLRWDSGELVMRFDYSKFDGKTINAIPTINAFNFPSGPGALDVTPTYVAGSRSAEQIRTVNAPVITPLTRDNSTWGIMADLRQDVGPVTINYLGSYRKFIRHEDGATIRGQGATVVQNRFDGNYWQQSHELRLSTNSDGPLKAQAGVYYFQEQSGIGLYLLGQNGILPGNAGYTFGFPQNPTKAKSYAGFAQVTYSATPELRLTAGVRYSKDEKSRVGATVTCVTTACNLPTDTIQVNNAARNFGQTTWRLGLDYDLNDRSLFYATVSTGYKAGGFNDGCEPTVTPTCTTTSSQRTASALYYDPETLTSYEVGLKTRLFDNALRLTMAAFHYDYKNLQLSQIIVCTPTGGTCQNTTNAAAAKVDGVEMEATFQPGPNDKIDFGINYLNARYADYKPSATYAIGANVGGVVQTVAGTAVVDFKGRQLDRSPTWTGTASYTHTFDLGSAGNIQAGIHSRFSDSYRLAAFAQLIQFRQPSFTKTDLTLTYNAADSRYYVQAYAKNLENNIVVTTASAGPNGTIQLGDPLTYGVRAGVKF